MWRCDSRTLLYDGKRLVGHCNEEKDAVSIVAAMNREEEVIRQLEMARNIIEERRFELLGRDHAQKHGE